MTDNISTKVHANEAKQIKLIQKNVGFLYPYGLEQNSIFWPAMIIPEHQIDSSLPKITKDEMLLQFFEKKVSVVPKNDETFVLWNPEIEPFKTFTMRYYNHKTGYIRKAAIFMTSGYIDHSLKWKFWKELTPTESPESRDLKRRKEQNSRNSKKLLKSIKDSESDLSDWTDASSLISIEFMSTVSHSTLVNQASMIPVAPKNLQSVHDQFVNLLMKDGKKAKSAALVQEALIVLKSTFPNESPIDLLNKAVAKASPLLKLVSQKRGAKSIQIPTPLTLRQQRRFGIVWIIDGANKRSIGTKNVGKYTFGTKLAQEIIGVLQGSSYAIDKKRDLYKQALVNKANILMNPITRK